MGNKQFTFKVNENKLIVSPLKFNKQVNKPDLTSANVDEYYKYVAEVLTRRI
jgi:hypothetical protein